MAAIPLTAHAGQELESLGYEANGLMIQENRASWNVLFMMHFLSTMIWLLT
jgi:hypothetical protein